MRDSGSHLSLDILARGLQLALNVNVGGGDESVNPRTPSVTDRLPGRVDVLLGGTRQTADDGAFDLAGDRLDRLEVAR